MIDCSLDAQREALSRYPDLREHGFNAVGGVPTTEPAIMEKLVEWIQENPPHKNESSYAYKHRAEDGRDWHPRTGAAIDKEPADVGYVSNGEIILACILAGYIPVPYGVNCEFKKGGNK